MPQNRGKDFEEVVRTAFNKVSDTSVVRLPDPVQGYLGIRNHCDFIVYHKPYEYHIECKSIHGNTFPLSNITKNQWDGLLEKSKIDGVIAGVMCWWVDRDITSFIPIQFLKWQKDLCRKSIHYGLTYEIEFEDMFNCVEIKGKKKRVFFDYDMEKFFEDVSRGYMNVKNKSV